jgi:hypothetical protein
MNKTDEKLFEMLFNLHITADIGFYSFFSAAL